MIIDSVEIRAFCHLHFCAWTPEAMHRAYEAVVTTWSEAGVPPNQLAAKAPGVGTNYGSFKHKRKRLENTNFENVRHFSMSHLVAGGVNSISEAKAYIGISSHFNWVTFFWIPAMIGLPARALIDLLPKLATFGKARYGHLVYRNTLNKRRPWWLGLPEPMKDGFLFDVYHRNYLNEAHLDARFGKTAMTVREWIEEKPDERGELKSFTDTLIEWTPPIENIALLREQLFRAGRIYYHRFFAQYRHLVDGYPISAGMALELPDQSVLELEPFYRRDIYEPWEWTGPIPEIYSAKHYEGMDPEFVPPIHNNY